MGKMSLIQKQLSKGLPLSKEDCQFLYDQVSLAYDQVITLMQQQDRSKEQVIEAKRAAMFDFGKKLEAESKLGLALVALKKIAKAENCPLTGLGSNYKTMLALDAIKDIEEDV